MLSWLMWATAANAAPVLSTTPFVRGFETDLNVTGAASGDSMYFAYSLAGSGAGNCFPSLGICADILSPTTLIGRVTADAQGRATVRVTIPPFAPLGTQVWVQVLETGTNNSKSNVVRATVAEPSIPTVHCNDGGPDAPVVRRVQPTQTTFEGYDVYYYMPTNPVGVIWYFYGGTNLATEVYADEQVATMLNQMGALEHFAFVATERTQQGGNAAWDRSTAPNQNQDMQRMNRLRNHLISTTALNATHKSIMTGFSDGAIFSTTFAYDAKHTFNWPVAAATPHSGAVGDAPDVPTMFSIIAHEEGQVVSNLTTMVNQLTQAHIPVVVDNIPERVVTPAMFLREDNWDMTDAQGCFDDLVAHGLINASGQRLVADAQIENALSNYQATSTFFSSGVCNSRIHILWSTHRYNAYSTNDECQFILDAM